MDKSLVTKLNKINVSFTADSIRIGSFNAQGALEDFSSLSLAETSKLIATLSDSLAGAINWSNR